MASLLDQMTCSETFFDTWASYVDHDGQKNFVQAGLLHQMTGKG